MKGYLGMIEDRVYGVRGEIRMADGTVYRVTLEGTTRGTTEDESFGHARRFASKMREDLVGVGLADEKLDLFVVMNEDMWVDPLIKL